jgi:hypothetical protein
VKALTIDTGAELISRLIALLQLRSLLGLEPLSFRVAVLDVLVTSPLIQ